VLAYRVGALSRLPLEEDFFVITAICRGPIIGWYIRNGAGWPRRRRAAAVPAARAAAPPRGGCAFAHGKVKGGSRIVERRTELLGVMHYRPAGAA
jgi:hypothetical protein